VPNVRPDSPPGDQPSGNNDTLDDHNTQTGEHKVRPYDGTDYANSRKPFEFD